MEIFTKLMCFFNMKPFLNYITYCCLVFRVNCELHHHLEILLAMLLPVLG